MRCPECGNEINENDVFCGSCGAEIIYNTVGAVGEPAPETPAESASEKKKRPSKKSGGEKKSSFKTAVRVFAAVIIIAVIGLVSVNISSAVKASAGRKVFDSVPLGRDIDMIETETGTAFISGKNSKYGALNHIADYDYICEAEKGVNVGGVEVPEWAVLLRKSSSGAVDEAVLYNFSVIKHNWMGGKTASELEISTVEYGSTLKAAERRLGLKPYTIIKESTDNTSTYVYRYHYVDDETGNTVVKNFYVVLNDVDGKVKDARDERLDYLKLILRAE